MSFKTATVIAKVEEDLKIDFLEATKRNHISAAQVIRDLMRLYIRENQYKLPDMTHIERYNNIDDLMNAIRDQK